MSTVLDTLKESKAYKQGQIDARVVAKTCSPADLRARLYLLNTDHLGTDPYMRGFALELRRLTEQHPPPPGVRRGQGGACHGLLQVRLVGPAGCGKSLVAGILRCVLPLLPLERFVVEEHVE